MSKFDLSIIAVESPISDPLLKRLILGANRYHSFTALRNESSHRIIAEIHFSPLNIEGKRKTGFFANIFNALNYISCRYDLQSSFIKVAQAVGWEQNIPYLTSKIKQVDKRIPQHYHAQTLLTGQNNEILEIWDEAVKNANTLSSKKIIFSSTGTQSTPTINCRTGTKFIATTLGKKLMTAKTIKHHAHTQVGLRANLHKSPKLTTLN